MALWKFPGWLALLLSLTAVVCSAQQGYDLTGTWADDVGGHYRIRQAGNTVAWYSDRSPVVTNVFSGTITGNTLDGFWWDLPGGQLMGSGRLLLRIESNDRLIKTASNPAYGGTVITRIGRSGATPGTGSNANACGPVGTWNWLDGASTVLHPDGTVTSTTGSTARWQFMGENTVRLTWNNGSIDTLTIDRERRLMTGSNSAGRPIQVVCATPNTGAAPTTGGGGGGGICADPRTQVIMDRWLSMANPPDNTRPGWNVHYDLWGRLVGRTPSSTIIGLPQGVDTPLTRCEYLWSGADMLKSTNLGTLRQYLEQNRP